MALRLFMETVLHPRRNKSDDDFATLEVFDPEATRLNYEHFKTNSNVVIEVEEKL